MKNLKKSIIGLIISLIILASSVVPSFAAENNSLVTVVKSTVGEVVFKNVDENPNQSYEAIDKDGNPCTISIEKVEVPSLTRAPMATMATRTWKVSFIGGAVNCHYYMSVSSNVVTSVYDYSILTIGVTYSNVVLSKTSSYGKLAFDTTAYLGLVQGNCWLKGSVTGSNNDIIISYKF